MSTEKLSPGSIVSKALYASALSTLLLAGGCGGDAAEPSSTLPTPGAGTAQPQAPATVAKPPTTQSEAYPSEKPQVVFQARPSKPSPEVAVYLEEREPTDHGWESEVLQVEAKAALHGALDALMQGNTGALAERLADSFTTTELRPKQLEPVPGDRAAQIWRPKTIDPERLAGTAAQAALGSIRAVFEGAQDLRSEVEVVGCLPGEDGRFQTEALIVLSGVRGEERIQISSSWQTDWLIRPEALPVASGLTLLNYEEVRLPRALFGDLTSHVFGAHPFFRAEFLLGVDDYYHKMDRLIAAAFIGSQGLAVGDANGDGLDDVFVAQQDGMPNRLFLRQPDGRALDASATAGIGFLDAIRSALFLDLDNDGDQDLAMAYGANILIVDNDGRGVFSNPRVLNSKGLNNVFSMCAADPDNDGDLDIYACHYILSGGGESTLPAPYYDANNGSPNHYWRNEGNGQFVDATEEVGFGVNNQRFSFSAVWEDFDLDGDPDLYVTNDFGRNNLYRNDGGKFVDVAEESGAIDMAAGMGATVDDYDHDGDMDIYISNMFMAEGARILAHDDMFRDGEDKHELPQYKRIARGNTLLRNKGDGTFEDVTMEAGVWRGGWAWGATFGDFDNDGWSDIYVPNGFTTGWSDGDVDSFHWRSVTARAPKDGTVTQEYILAWAALEHMVMEEGASWSGHERNRVYMNTGDGRFADIGAASTVDFLEDSRAVAMLDWDDDGRLDMVLKNRTAPRLRLLRNQDTGAGNYLAVDLQGVNCNRDGIGARVEIQLKGGAILRRTLRAGEGYIAQSSKRLHFGLGAGAEPESLTVYWPNGAIDKFEELLANRRYRIVEGQKELVEVPAVTLTELASKTTEHIEKPEGIQVDRLVLAERLPLGPFRVPSFDDEDRTVSEFEGVPVLFDMWASYGEDCPLELRRFGRRRAELKEAGIFVIPLTLDDPEHYDRAKAMLDEVGLANLAGYLDKQARMAFEVILTATLGHTLTTPLPTSFLVDEQGNLAVIYMGPVRVPQLIQDVQLLRAAGPEDTTGQVLLGGQWLTPRTRNFKQIVNALRMLGERTLGDYFMVLHRNR